MLRTSVGLLLYFCVSITGAAPHVAFYYGPNPPWDELKAFDVVVVEPAHAGGSPAPIDETRAFAYVSVGEIEYERPYAKELPEGIVKGSNDAWRSHVVDQTHEHWAPFFVERIVAPLWEAGYRGFFLDTLDSFHLIANDDAERARQAQALASVIRAMRARFPEAKLIFNRGFEVLPELHGEVYAVAAESLFRGWDQKNRAYVEVPAADRDWLLEHLERVRTEYGLPVIVIEYVPPGQRDLARATARKVAELGFIPWVTNADHDLLGVGNIEATPRRVLILHDAADRDAKLYAHRTHVQVRAVFEKLGYAVDYADVGQPLPVYPLVGRYAGIVSWFANDRAVMRPGVREWLTRQRDDGMRMAMLGSFPFPLSDTLALAFGLSVGAPRIAQSVTIETADPLVSPHARPLADALLFTPLHASSAARPLLRLRSDRGDIMDAAALMPWGGYVLKPYESAPGPAGDRWLIEPVEFMRRALALPSTAAAPRVGGSNASDARSRAMRPHELQPNASERSALSETS